MTTWERTTWRIRINNNEALVRQRFTLAHEIKHIIDAPHLETTYHHIASRTDGDQQIENICDYFAACLLMPKKWVKRLSGQGINNLQTLADTFEVSTTAMHRRLQHLGITQPNPHNRHATTQPWARQSPSLTPYRFHRAHPPPQLQEQT